MKEQALDTLETIKKLDDSMLALVKKLTEFRALRDTNICGAKKLVESAVDVDKKKLYKNEFERENAVYEILNGNEQHKEIMKIINETECLLEDLKLTREREKLRVQIYIAFAKEST